MGKKVKMKTGKSLKRTSDVFAFFKETTSDAFSFLVSDFGFKLVSTSVYPPECAIKYQSVKTGVTVCYEWESDIWVVLSRLQRNGADVFEAEKVRPRCSYRGELPRPEGRQAFSRGPLDE